MANKSTPLAQLPSSQQQQQLQTPPNNFVNDQHRQLVTQAHSAVQNFVMPVNTQLGGEYSKDEDAVIQDTLMHLNGVSDSAPPPIIKQLAPLQSQTELNYPSPVNAPLNQGPASPSPAASSSPGVAQNSQDMLNTSFNHSQHAPVLSWWSCVGDNDDLKMALLVALITVALCVLPIDRLIQEYVPYAISQITYVDLFGKASIAAVTFYILRAFLI